MFRTLQLQKSWSLLIVVVVVADVARVSWLCNAVDGSRKRPAGALDADPRFVHKGQRKKGVYD
jgi:hypothetical protein